MIDRSKFNNVVLDWDGVASIKASLRKLHAFTDILCEGDLSDVQPESIRILADAAGMAVIEIDVQIAAAEQLANPEDDANA